MAKYRLTTPAEYYPASTIQRSVSGMPCLVCGGRHSIGQSGAYRVEPVDAAERQFFVIGYAAQECARAAGLVKIGA
jgi:hypothetical protein